MAQSNKPVPSAEQQRIVDADANANVIVVAGAGSGKTFTMTERVIHLIHEGVPPEHILGLTFTNKAASELLSRVSKAVLDDARERAREGGPHPARLAFMKPDVRTYDAFFQSIVRQYGLLVGFDPQTQPLSVAGARQIIASVVGRHVDEIVQLPVDMGSFGTVVDAVGALANNIANSMIGNGCLTVADAIERITQWDAAFRTQILDLLQTDETGLLTGPLADRQRGATPKAVKDVLKARKKAEKKGGEYVETPGDKDAVGEAIHADAELAARDLYLVAMKRDVLLGLVREFDEEFSLRITVGERVAVLENLFSHRGVEFHSIEFYYHVTPTVSLIEGITAQESDLETEFWTPKCGLEVRPVQCVELLRRGW